MMIACYFHSSIYNKVSSKIIAQVVIAAIMGVNIISTKISILVTYYPNDWAI
jgi:hypothetical protein